MDMLAGRMHTNQQGLKAIFNVFKKRGILLPGVTIPNMKKINEAKKRAKEERRRARSAHKAAASTPESVDASISTSGSASAKRKRQG